MKFKLTLKLWIFLFAMIFALLSLFATPYFLQQGVVVTSVERNSTAFEQGFRTGQLITEIEGKPITELEDYTEVIQKMFLLNGINESVRAVFNTNEGEIFYYSNTPPEITVSKSSNTNLKTGLDISGGSRALVRAKDADLSMAETRDLAEMIKKRLDVFGIEDINVNPISDLEGNNYIAIEIAGATPDDIQRLISEQGRFEAKIGNQTVFVGEDRDISSVARSGVEAGIETCQQIPDEQQYVCRFRFAVYLSEAAARRHAELTKDLDINRTQTGIYLNETLDLYLDGNLIDSLLISENLRGAVTTQISIQGSASGETESDAYDNARNEMNSLQTILITGSLPYELEIVKMDTISPALGGDFMRAIFIAGGIAILTIFFIVLVRYKNLKVALSLVFTSISEVIIILGIASFIRWNLDLPSIAGIFATIGTGIDSQIIILDESEDKSLSLKQRLKRAFAIILGAYFTVLVALLPLYWAVAGLFKGFAFTAIIGVTVGVFITRPAFSDIIKKILD